MLIVSGTLLVLLTWANCLVGLSALGLTAAVLVSRGPVTWTTLRSSLWWGLLVASIFSYSANLLWPLQSGSTAIAGFALLLVLVAVGVLLARRRGLRLRSTNRGVMVWLWVALAFATAYLAVAALGPVTNYDTGLYHLGAIRYSAEFASIPGLANLYFPLGYGNAEFPLAALMGNGPWGLDGFRLLNGLIFTAAAVDLAVRSRGRSLSAGFYVLAVGLTAAAVPMVALSDYWVTSPTQDSAVLFVTVVATAYLADAVAGRRDWVSDGSTAMALAILLVMLRPTMAVFAVALLVVLAACVWRRRHGEPSAPWSPALVVIAVLGTVAALVATARDYLLSGWLQYPLSVYQFDVPWAAADPTSFRLATLGFHRNPNDLWGATSGWAWVGDWLVRLPRQWETFLIAAMAVVSVTLVALAWRSRHGPRWRAMLVAMAPSAAATAFWFAASPPSFRFNWGPAFTLLAIPIGWALWRMPAYALRLTVVGAAVPVVLVTMFSALARFDWSSVTVEKSWAAGIHYAVSPVTDAAVVPRTLPSGLVITSPVATDQCWANYPLCTPVTSESLELRGQSIADGFLP